LIEEKKRKEKKKIRMLVSIEIKEIQNKK